MADAHKEKPGTPAPHPSETPKPGTPPPAHPPEPHTPETPTPKTDATGTSGIMPLSVQTAAIPIMVWRVNNATHALPQILRLAEGVGITVNVGTPVVVMAGYVVERTLVASTDQPIAGFTVEAGHNLTANGLPPIGGSGLYYGQVPNQINARNVPLGAPMADGALGVYMATDETIFVGKTDSPHALAYADIAQLYGMTKDPTTGNWFVDTTITGASTTTTPGLLVQPITLVDPIGTLGGRLAFRVIRRWQQFYF